MSPMTIRDLHARYAAGVSPSAVLDDVWRRIDAAGDPGIFLALTDRTRVRAAIDRLGPFDPVAKPLWGVPFAIKDNIDLADTPTTAACPAFAYTPQSSAPCVERLIAAGAIPVGKTNLDQFATGLVGVRTPYPVPRNACDPALIPGGSSSGSAVAVARGLVAFALGTDTAGSGRVPAALNGLVGLKPSLGVVPTRGVVPACRTLDCVSVFATNVADAWTAFAAMAGYDPEDPWSRRMSVPPPGALPPALRIGVPRPAQREFFGDRLAEAAYDAHLRLLEPFASLVEIDIAPFLETARLLYEGPWVAERYAAIRARIDRAPETLHPVTRAIIEGGRKPSAADAFEAVYRLAALRRTTEPVWERVDALCLPTIPTVYTVAAVEADPVTLNSRLGTYTNFVNLLDLCALAVPGALRQDGRPAGVTLIAPSAQDGLLAAVGGAFTGEPGWAGGVDDRTVPFVVVGAHMSGLPLNRELVATGARFVAATVTAPVYRLFELNGGPPRRPGLLRVAPPEGRSISVELWSMPEADFGPFVARIVTPLTVGTVQLADGRQAKGFLVEAEAVRGARDITAHGGWRAWLARSEPSPAAS